MTRLCIPEAVLEQHMIVLGKTGAGKSSALRHVVEHLLHKNKRVCIIDPKGEWYGLKIAADGKGPGFPVIGFGSFKDEQATDVPINQYAGKEVAELVTSGNRPAIIGMQGWGPSHMGRFWTDFIAYLFKSRLAGGLTVVVSEIQNFAPKERMGFGEENMALYWAKKLTGEGRGVGLTGFFDSQRPQKVHNDVLTQCETLVAMRLTHDSDCQAVETWLKRTRDKAIRDEIMTGLAEMKRGTGWVWSPECGFGPQKVSFPFFETFDSFAPPQAQKKVSAAGWAGVDLDAVKEKFAAVIEEAKANDPKELKRRLVAVTQERDRAMVELNKPGRNKAVTSTATAKPDPQLAATVRQLQAALEKAMRFIVKVQAFNIDGNIDEARFHEGVERAVTQALEKAKGILDEKSAKLTKLKNEAEALLQQLRTPTTISVAVTQQESVSVSEPQTIHKQQSAEPQTNGALGDSLQRILDTVAMLYARGLKPNRDMVARWMLMDDRQGIHPNGGRYGENLGTLRSQGYLDGWKLTDIGQSQAGKLATGFEAACKTVTGSEEKILRCLLDNPGVEFTRDTLAEALGIHPNGGRYGESLGRLRTMELIPPARSPITLTEAATK